MASILQDLELFEAIAGDVVAFAAGNPVTTTRRFGNTTYSISVVVLPGGPVAPYQVFTGSFFSILGLVLEDAAGISAGQPIQVAEKVNHTWYGTTVEAIPTGTTGATALKVVGV
jgi:hypothetical protein